MRRLSAASFAATAAIVAAGCAGSLRMDPEAEAHAVPREVVWPPPPAAPRIAWDGSFTQPQDLGIRVGLWGRARRWLFGAPDDDLGTPQGLAVVGHRVYVTDAGRARVLIYDLEREQFRALSATARRPWQVPISVAALRDGTMFVVDARGYLFRAEPPYTTATALPWPDLRRPVAVAEDQARGRLYVLDAGSHRLHRGRLDGAYAGSVGARGTAPGQFNFPTHLCVAPDGTLLITDAMNFRIQHLTPDGAVLRVFGQAGDGTGHFAKPKGVAIDGDGTIYVVDALHGVVQLFDADGRFLLHIGASGRQAGEFWLPTGIAVDDAGRIYVADSYNHRVQMFVPAGEHAS